MSNLLNQHPAQQCLSRVRPIQLRDLPLHGVFIHLETRVGHVYNYHKEGVEEEKGKYAPLTKAVLHSQSPGGYFVVEPHACSHAIEELINGRYHTF